MKVKMDVSADIVVCCAECSADLGACKHQDFGNHLMVEPCPNCSGKKTELPDGWYLVHQDGDVNACLRRKAGDRAYNMVNANDSCWSDFTVLKKVTMEEIDDVYKD